MPMGTCAACQCPNVRVAPATTECACLVCERCALQFSEAGVCGVCETPFRDDEVEAEDTEELP